MKRNEPRRNKHHFLPRHLLEHFARDDGQLYVYDRKDRWSHRLDIPERLAVEKHLYSPEATDDLGRDPKDDAVEVWLADNIDGPAALPISKLVSGSDLQSLGSDETHAIANFLAIQDLRTPRVRDLMVKWLGDAGREAILDHKRTRRELFRQGIRTSLGEIRRMARKHVESIVGEQAKPGWLDYLKESRPIARVNVKGRRWSIVDAPEGEEFLTSDLGIVKSILGPHQPVPWYPGTAQFREHWLVPISPRRAIALSPHQAPDPIGTPEIVRITNRQIIADARRYVYSRAPVDLEALT